MIELIVLAGLGYLLGILAVSIVLQLKTNRLYILILGFIPVGLIMYDLLLLLEFTLAYTVNSHQNILPVFRNLDVVLGMQFLQLILTSYHTIMDYRSYNKGDL